MLTLLVLGLLSSLPAQDPPRYRVDAPSIKVPVTVFDSQGRALLGLTRDDFQLLDEGEPRRIQNFVLDRTPVHVVLLLDVSGSLSEELEEIREAAVEFASAFSREDRISVIAFADRVELIQDWTNSRRAVRRSMKKLERGYRTALYDALLVTAQERLEKVQGKRVILLLTDGIDNESDANFQTVLQRLIASDISLYIVSRTRLLLPQVESSERVEFLNQVMKNLLQDEQSFVEAYFQEKEASMRRLAETSGGRALFPLRLEELKEAYQQIARELKTQYLLTFLPPPASELEFRQIQVICTQPVGKIFHRRLYRVP